MRSIFAAAAMVLTMGAAADAEIVGSGPAFGNGQTVAVCYYSNLGAYFITFSSATIHREPHGSELGLTAINGLQVL